MRICGTITKVVVFKQMLAQGGRPIWGVIPGLFFCEEYKLAEMGGTGKLGARNGRYEAWHF
jgi:hypothetical protein